MTAHADVRGKWVGLLLYPSPIKPTSALTVESLTSITAVSLLNGVQEKDSALWCVYKESIWNGEDRCQLVNLKIRNEHVTRLKNRTTSLRFVSALLTVSTNFDVQRRASK